MQNWRGRGAERLDDIIGGAAGAMGSSVARGNQALTDMIGDFGRGALDAVRVDDPINMQGYALPPPPMPPAVPQYPDSVQTADGRIPRDWRNRADEEIVRDGWTGYTPPDSWNAAIAPPVEPAALSPPPAGDVPPNAVGVGSMDFLAGIPPASDQMIAPGGGYPAPLMDIGSIRAREEEERQAYMDKVAEL